MKDLICDYLPAALFLEDAKLDVWAWIRVGHAAENENMRIRIGDEWYEIRGIELQCRHKKDHTYAVTIEIRGCSVEIMNQIKAANNGGLFLVKGIVLPRAQDSAFAEWCSLQLAFFSGFAKVQFCRLVQLTEEQFRKAF